MMWTLVGVGASLPFIWLVIWIDERFVKPGQRRRMRAEATARYRNQGFKP